MAWAEGCHLGEEPGKDVGFDRGSKHELWVNLTLREGKGLCIPCPAHLGGKSFSWAGGGGCADGGLGPRAAPLPSPGSGLRRHLSLQSVDMATRSLLLLDFFLVLLFEEFFKLNLLEKNILCVCFKRF